MQIGCHTESNPPISSLSLNFENIRIKNNKTIINLSKCAFLFSKRDGSKISEKNPKSNNKLVIPLNLYSHCLF